jgi:RNA polymerase sigma-70 factor, ECF subfamily
MWINISLTCDMIDETTAGQPQMITNNTQEVFGLRSDADFARFETMFAATRKRAYSMALQLTRNVNDAEDLVQDTYIKAWRGFDSYIPGKPFLNWVLRIMQRAFLDARRRENPIRKADSLNTMVSPSDGELQELPIADRGPSPNDEVLYDEFRRNLYFALNQLPDVYQDAIRLCDLEGLSYHEIADMQNTTIGTVRSRIHRGRRLLRDIINRSEYTFQEA